MAEPICMNLHQEGTSIESQYFELCQKTAEIPCNTDFGSLTGGPRGWLAARRFCILLIVLILDQVIPVIYIYRNLAAVILTSH